MADPKSDLSVYRLGLSEPISTLLNDRSLSAKDFLNRVDESKDAYQTAADELKVDLSDLCSNMRAMVAAAKAAGIKPADNDTPQPPSTGTSGSRGGSTKKFVPANKVSAKN